jgi:galactokinase
VSTEEARSVAGTWSAPGRVNLIGEHTDYNGGLALPFALPLRTSVRAGRRDDDAVVARSAGRETVTIPVSTEPGGVRGWGAYVAGTVWALREAGHRPPAADLTISSDIPTGAGLSSSAALECATALALTGLDGGEVGPTELALLAQRAENEYVGAPTGAMDQMASMHGRLGHVVLFDAEHTTVELVPCDLAAAGLVVLVIDTRATHQHVDGEYGERRRTCHDAAARIGVPSLRHIPSAELDAALHALGDDEVAVRRVRHVVTENTRVRRTVDLLRRLRVPEIGPLLTASHASLRDDFEVSVPELDVAVDAALSAGAHGARMTGGGFGGSAIALVDVGRREAVEQRVLRAYAERGFARPTFTPVVPSAGAGRDGGGV